VYETDTQPTNASEGVVWEAKARPFQQQLLASATLGQSAEGLMAYFPYSLAKDVSSTSCLRGLFL
jgi:hypothetical protein